MSNPSGPDERGAEADRGAPPAQDAEDHPVDGHPATAGDDPATEVLASAAPESWQQQPPERRFTAPSSYDDGSTQKIDPPSDPATEILSVPQAPGDAAGANTDPFAAQRSAGPQVIPPRGDAPPPTRQRRSWGWVVAVMLVIAALVAVAILATVLLTRKSEPAVSQEDRVRQTIENFDVAIQTGDLATLRSITCGSTRDSYVNYDEDAWTETHDRVAAAKQYPVVASIDQVVVNGEHAEANVTTFMASAPQTRSTRSFDLQFRDDRWKICQAPSS